MVSALTVAADPTFPRQMVLPQGATVPAPITAALSMDTVDQDRPIATAWAAWTIGLKCRRV